MARSIASLVAAVCMAAASPAGAQSRTVADLPLKELSLEELMSIDVTGVLRRGGPIAETPAAVDVITGDDIRRSGASTLPEVLRMATGLTVAQSNGRTWGVTARGFQTTTTNKLLVLIDGRSIYTPLFSGVFWDVQDLVLEDIDRIEVIRGPGATLWGANAVNGIINIITKTAAQTMDGLVTLTAGTEQRAIGVVRYGDRLSETAHYRMYAKYRSLDALATPQGASAGDSLRNGQIGGRLDWSNPRSRFTLSGDGYLAEAGQPGLDDLDLNGLNLLGRWTTRFDDESELQVQGYYDRTYRLIPELFEETRGTWDVDLQYRLPRHGRHLVLFGGGYRLSRDETVPSPTVRFDPLARRTNLMAAFIQDEIVIRPDSLDLMVGARVERNAFSGVEAQPTLRVRWAPRSRHMVWGGVSRAVRMPTRLDSDIRFLDPEGAVILRGSDAFRSEVVMAYEVGYRVQPQARVAIDVAAFHNRYDHLRSQEPEPDGGPIVLRNLLRGRSSGLELKVSTRPLPWMRWDTSVTAFSKTLERRPGGRDPQLGATEGNDPGHTVKVRGALDLPGPTELHVFLRHIGALPSPPVPRYTELDLRVGWWVTRDVSLAVSGRNLLNERHAEFGSPATRSEIERSVAVHATFGF